MGSAAAPDKADEERVIGGRASPSEIRIIDFAASLLGKTRAEFIVSAAMEKASQVIQVESPKVVAELQGS